MNGSDRQWGPVPQILLIVGSFLIAESLTFTVLAPRSHGASRVDFIDFGFVFASAVLITVIGALEGARLHTHRSALSVSAVAGIVLGIAAGFFVIWASRFGI